MGDKNESEGHSKAFWVFVVIMGLYALLSLLAWVGSGFRPADLIAYLIFGLILAGVLRFAYFLFAVIYRKITGNGGEADRREGKREDQTRQSSQKNEKKEQRSGYPTQASEVTGKADLTLDEGKEIGKVKNYSPLVDKKISRAESSTVGQITLELKRPLLITDIIQFQGDETDFHQRIEKIEKNGEEIEIGKEKDTVVIPVRKTVPRGVRVILTNREEKQVSQFLSQTQSSDHREHTGTTRSDNSPSQTKVGAQEGVAEKDSDKSGNPVSFSSSKETENHSEPQELEEKVEDVEEQPESSDLREKRKVEIRKIVSVLENRIITLEEAEKEDSAQKEANFQFRSITPIDLDKDVSLGDIAKSENSETTESEEEDEKQEKSEESLNTGIMPSSLDEGLNTTSEEDSKFDDSLEENGVGEELDGKTSQNEDIAFKDDESNKEGINYEIIERSNREDFEYTNETNKKEIGYKTGIDFSQAENGNAIEELSKTTFTDLSLLSKIIPDTHFEGALKKKDSNHQYTYQQSLSSYTKEIDYKILNREEEKRLAKRIETGSTEAKKELARHNLRLVMSRAKRFRGFGIPFVDIIQAGNLGLMKAVERFDYREGAKFSTYGVNWIEQAIRRTLNRHSRTVRLPAHILTVQRKARRIKRRQGNRGKNPSHKEIADELDTTEEKIKRALSHEPKIISLDEITRINIDKISRLGEVNKPEVVSRRQSYLSALRKNLEENHFDEQAAKLSQVVPSKHTPNPEIKARKQKQLKKLYTCMQNELSDRSRRILILRFGLKGHEPNTLEDIGRIFGISRERVRQLEGRALDDLWSSLNEGSLRYLVRSPKDPGWRDSEIRIFKKILSKEHE